MPCPLALKLSWATMLLAPGLSYSCSQPGSADKQGHLAGEIVPAERDALCPCNALPNSPGCLSLPGCSYMVLFLKFISSVVPTINYDYTMPAGNA